MTPQPQFRSLPPLSLYIHIPWCVRKCPYCDFNSHSAGPEIPEAAYTQALIDDLEQDTHLAQGRPLQSIFFGGGTPSLFSAEAINTILQAVEQRIPFAPDIEITLEANPGTFEQEKFIGFRQAGINRLSIGIQSFNDTHLQKLGRIHNAEEAQKAVASAQQSGFDNINLDLMHGLPDQSPEEALADLELATCLGPQHISWYQLTIEPNTEFHKRPPQLPAENILGSIQQRGEQWLAEKGYAQYEVSAYGQPNRQSQHNLNYWRFGDYLGIGAGAHGKIMQMAEQQIIRTRKTRLPRDYLDQAKPFTAETKPIPNDELAGEFMMNALRLNQGFGQELFEKTTGIPLSTISTQLHEAHRQGLLNIDPIIRPSATGKRFLDNLVSLFFGIHP